MRKWEVIMVSLSQPVAIITGAGRGIGRATAVLLSSLGYACVLCARSIEELNVTAALCSSATRTIVCDVTQPQQIAGVVEQTLAAFERIDLLVNNAGIAPLVPFDQIDDDALAATIDVNLTGTLRFSRAVWNVMKRQGEGVIVNVSSESARDPFPGFAVYGAAKAGVNLLTRALAKEGQAAGIRVYAVAPSGVET
ncbi:MAG TPA: SDR family oxidoreductase, partial [Tepidisphaeraceae bacterium]